uniref:Nuclear fusion protein n=1 Tax=Kluyveromyces lactis TaxID=28985 RepID=Q9HFM3_KLULC|nr:nuclear fusion protein [Kluyveromyces lactis]
MDNQDCIGLVIEVPNIGRGQIRYIGSVETKKGTFVGINLFAGNGKNDGTFRGRRYFETSFPQSGLFIQWEKIANLIPIPSNPEANMTIPPASPTPVRINANFLGYHEPLQNSFPEIKSRTSISNVIQPNDDPMQTTSSDLKMLQTELVQYKRLVEDQRIVFEEIQAAIDEYETKLDTTEKEKVLLQNQLDHERTSHQRQKQFYESEHDQLLTVIDELQSEINRNAAILAEIMQKEKKNSLENDYVMQDEPNSDALLINDLREQILELQQHKTQAELHRVQWEKEKEQLQFRNQSLSKNYKNLTTEMTEYQQKSHDTETKEYTLNKELDDARKKIGELESRVEELSKKQEENTLIVDSNIETLPLYNPGAEVKSTLVNAAAGRSLWCALCEKDGHESVDCPYDDKFF